METNDIHCPEDVFAECGLSSIQDNEGLRGKQS